MPELAALHAGFDELLEAVETTFRLRPEAPVASEPLPDLRARYLAIQRPLRGDARAQELLAELDEMVDAANGLAAAAGLESVDASGGPEAEPERYPRVPAWLTRIWS
jgi:hypothetical protein